MLEVIIATVERIIFEGKARSIILPGEQGVFEILPFHKPLLSRLISGCLIVDGKPYPVRRGIAGVSRNTVTVIFEQ